VGGFVGQADAGDLTSDYCDTTSSDITNLSQGRATRQRSRRHGPDHRAVAGGLAGRFRSVDLDGEPVHQQRPPLPHRQPAATGEYGAAGDTTLLFGLTGDIAIPLRFVVQKPRRFAGRNAGAR
jgi:hypothetical protein